MKNQLAVKLFGISLFVFCGFLSGAKAAPGDLDTTFATTGFNREASSLGSFDSISATVIQPDGKIVSVGVLNYGDNLGCGITRHNADGSLDSSFDSDGKSVVQIALTLTCRDVAVQADGKIVVVGYVQNGSVYNFAVFRYNSDGSPDTSFDGDGRKISAFINADQAHGVAIQTDGRIVVCGNFGDEFAVVRYNADGSFDSSFDGDGWAATDFFGGADAARAIAIQTDGKILVAGNGRTSGGSFNDFAVARYNPNGSLDTTFDGDGKVLTDIQTNHDNVQSIAIQTDGKIVVGGSSWGNNSDLGIARYNADGSLDTSFDGDGKLFADIMGTSDSFGELALQTDGKIVAVGGNGQMQLIRVNPNGSFDNTFDGDGKLNFSPTPGFDNGITLAIQPDGKIIAAGSGGAGFSQTQIDFTVVRLNPNASMDTSFDGDGVATVNLHNWKINANAVAIQPDGKIVAVGKTLLASINENFAVYRYNADGSLDTSFDGDGRVTTDFGNNFDEAFAVTVQPDGKIVVAGKSNAALVTVRYLSSGALDTSFGDSGAIIENGSVASYLKTIALQPDGKILVAGRRFINGYASTIYRYNPNGTRDTTFDGDGEVRTDLAGDDEITDMAIQSDGKIVVAGRAQDASYDFMVGRYNANGSLDTSFDGDGIATIDFVGGYDYVNAVEIQADGKIVVAGASSSSSELQSSNFDSALARLNPNGSHDTSFDGDGKVRVPVSVYSDTATGVVIQTNGKILTSGFAVSNLSNDLGTNDFALVRYNPNGSLDNSYGTNGKAITGLFNHDRANGIALDSSGRVVVAGETDGYFTVARFLGGASSLNVESPFDFDGDGKSDISIFRPSNGEWWYQRSFDAQVSALQFGASSDRITPADYTGDGKTDVAVWRPSTGEWFILRSEDFSYYSAPFGTNGDTPAPADFDADGKADLAIFRPSSGTWFVSKSTGGTDIVNFGQNGDVPTAADFDGDGKADIAIFRPSNGQWWLNRSTAGIFAATFGTATDKPVVGEYTGDGKSDIAFWRPTTGEWFILRSENQSFYSVPFGANGDTPTPGDYDGDGRFDTAVFRPSNLNWYINRTTSGLLIQQFGVAGDTPVPSAFVP